MTEEIIIDGVNVSECCFYNNSKCDNPNGMACNCINNTVCYFKELKRLEQENKELRKANEISIEKVTVTAEAKRLHELEQENESLKKQIESQKGLITVGGKQQYEYLQEIDELEQENKELQAYKDVNEDFKKAWDELNEKYKQLRSALEEIKNYLNTLSSIDSDFVNTETYLRINDKINEVLNEG